MIVVPALAYWTSAAIVAAGSTAIIANELMKSAAYAGANTKDTTENLKSITKDVVIITAIVGGVYLFNKYAKSR